MDIITTVVPLFFKASNREPLSKKRKCQRLKHKQIAHVFFHPDVRSSISPNAIHGPCWYLTYWQTKYTSWPGIGNFLQEFSRQLLYWEFGKCFIHKKDEFTPRHCFFSSSSRSNLRYVKYVQDCVQHLGIDLTLPRSMLHNQRTIAVNLQNLSQSYLSCWSYLRFQARIEMQSLKSKPVSCGLILM